MFAKIRKFKYVKELSQYGSFRETFLYVLNTIFSGIVGCWLGIAFQSVKAIILGMSILVIFMIVIVIVNIQNERTFNLIKILKEDQKNGKWPEILRLSYPLSRQLFLARKYRLRVEIGKLVNDACNHLSGETVTINNEKIKVNVIQASTLIDDLGWTLYQLGDNTETAKENIKLGITIAKENKELDKVIKGYRHLMGIASELKEDVSVIEKYREQMSSVLNNSNFIGNTDKINRELAVAGYHYSVARILVRFAEVELDIAKKIDILKEADQEIEQAMQIYISRDPDRYAKTFNVRADILMLNEDANNLAIAKNILQQGLAYCENLQRRDNYIRISLKLIELELKRLDSHSFSKVEKNEILHQVNNIYSNVTQELSSDKNDDEYRKKIEDLKKKVIEKCRN